MLLTLHPNWWDDWSLYHKVTFDGINRLIIINDDVNTIDVKADIYSDWKEWVQLRDNAKFLPALRVTGGDPTDVGQFSGDIYFLINNWRILVDHSCKIDGVIYSDNYPSPFVQVTGTQLVTNKVSSLVSVVSTSGGAIGDVPSTSEIASAVWSNSIRTLTAAPTYNGPTAVQIRQEIDSNSNRLSSIQSDIDSLPDSIRTELTPGLTKIMTLENKPGVTDAQATMLTELYAIMGLDPTKPLIVNTNSRTAGAGIQQTIATSPTQTVVTRT